LEKQDDRQLLLRHDRKIVPEGNMSIPNSRFNRRRLVGIAGVLIIAAVSFTGGYVVAAQPHMQNALGALQNARSELQMAESNKAGHRVNALRLVNEAIVEVQAGVAAGS
jgi:hypothetical protein